MEPCGWQEWLVVEAAIRKMRQIEQDDGPMCYARRQWIEAKAAYEAACEDYAKVV